MKPAIFAAALVALATPAAADVLIDVVDSDPTGIDFAGLSPANSWAFGWTQSGAYNDLSVEVVVTGGLSGSWWITTGLGPSIDASDMIGTGTYTAPVLTLSQKFAYDTAPYTTIASGLDLGPGTYFLVLDASALGNGWIGRGDPVLAPGFTLAGFYFALNPPPFRPSSIYGGATFNPAFRLESVSAAVPEPATWALMILGFASAGAALRRRPRLAG